MDIPSKWLVHTNKEVDKWSAALMAQPGRAKDKALETKDKSISPRRDLDARPKVYETFALPG